MPGKQACRRFCQQAGWRVDLCYFDHDGRGPTTASPHWYIGSPHPSCSACHVTMMRPNGGVSRPVSLSSNSSHSQNAPMPISGRSGSVPGGRGQQRARNVTASMAPAAAGAHPRHGQHLQQQQRQQVPAFTHQNQQQQLQQPQQPHQPQAQQPLAHQPQAPQQQQQQQPRRSNPAATLQARCHRCFKPLASNFYLLKTCNCVFCEGECTRRECLRASFQC